MSTVNRVIEVHDARGHLVRREWASPAVARALGIDPETEVAAQHLAARVGLAPPVLEFDRARRFMMMPFVDGLPLEADWVNRAERRAAVQAMIARLRSIDASSLPTLDIPSRILELHERLAHHSPESARRFRWEVEACIERRADIANDSDRLVHGDLTPQNVIVRGDGSLCLLDWEYAHRGHGDEDLAGLAVDTDGLENWSLASAQFGLRVRARRLLDVLWRELAAALPD